VSAKDASFDVSPDDPLKVQEISELDGGWAETRLKRHLGNGIYVQEVNELPEGDLEIVFGNSTPRDLSDCRNRDNYLKFISLRDVMTTKAEATGSGYYIVDLPSRETVVEHIDEREQELVDRLDHSMARAIYERVYDLSAVQNQLSPILQLLRWARRRPGFTVHEAVDNQRTDNTRQYISFLESFEYLDIQGETITRGPKLRAADLDTMGRDEFGRKFLGDVVSEGYHTIKDQFGFTMLNHYQKYSGAYYHDAIQKHDPDLWLNIEAIKENLDDIYGESKGSLFLHDKLDQLEEVNVLKKDGEYVQSQKNVYDKVVSEVPSV
jgi:hypothetical protein